MLRGTEKKRKYALLNTRPSLQNQITALKAQVNKQKPETQYYRTTGTFNATAQIQSTNYSITQSLINELDFRSNVTGDQWTNIALNLKFLITSWTQCQRVLIYVPKKAGTVFSPTATDAMVRQPDPTSFWTIADFGLNQTSTGDDSLHSRRVNLKGFKSHYDSDNTILDKGELMMMVVTNCAIGEKAHDYSWELVYNNL